MAVVDMCIHNKRVVFDILDGKDCSYYEDKKRGNRTRLGFTGRSWYMDLDVVDHADVPENIEKIIQTSLSVDDTVKPQTFNIGTPRRLSASQLAPSAGQAKP